MMLDDESLIEGCVKGKRDAQNSLYKRYASVMLGICMRYSKNRDEAEDILQESFIKVFLNIKGFRSEGSFEGWIKRIVVNTAISHIKKNLRQTFYEGSSEFGFTLQEGESDADESGLMEFNIGQEKLLELIQSLPTGYKTVFNMYVIEQMTHQEIAEMLGISVNTSKTQLHKARKYLKLRIIEIVKKKN